MDDSEQSLKDVRHYPVDLLFDSHCEKFCVFVNDTNDDLSQSVGILPEL